MLISLGLKQDVHILINFFPFPLSCSRVQLHLRPADVTVENNLTWFGWKWFLCLVSYERHVIGCWIKPNTNFGRSAGSSGGPTFRALPRLPWARYQILKCSDRTTNSLKFWELKMIFLLALWRRELFLFVCVNHRFLFITRLGKYLAFTLRALMQTLTPACGFAKQVSNPEFFCFFIISFWSRTTAAEMRNWSFFISICHQIWRVKNILLPGSQTKKYVNRRGFLMNEDGHTGDDLTRLFSVRAQT